MERTPLQLRQQSPCVLPEMDHALLRAWIFLHHGLLDVHDGYFADGKTSLVIGKCCVSFFEAGLDSDRRRQDC